MSSPNKQNEMCHKILTQQVGALQEVTEHYNKTLLEFLVKVQSEVLSLDVEDIDFQRRFEHMYTLVQQVIVYILSKTNEFKGALKNGTENQLLFRPASNSKAHLGFVLEDNDQETETMTSDQIRKDIESLEKIVFRMQKRSKEFEEKQTALGKTFQDLRCHQEDINEQIYLFRNEKQEKGKELQKGLNDFEDKLDQNQVKIETLEQEIKTVADSVKGLTSQFFSRNSFEKDAMKSMEDLSNKIERSEDTFDAIAEKVKKLEDSLKSLSCKFSDQLENPCTLSVEKYDTLDKKYGLLCQLVFKSLSSVEELKDTFNTNLVMKDSSTSKRDGIE
ncbi:unnamed protein product [Lymnaea stagnalis]|uniref:Uncharacterized protein n=1 Tax=Lymnaea stagnalis TaxID=6523 RepID=A0AAV2HTH3_LYMST